MSLPHRGPEPPPPSQQQRITRSFLWVSLFILVAKLAGAAKEMSIAWRYGVSETVDAYVFVFNLVTWPVALCFSILSAVLVPLIARLRHQTPGALAAFQRESLGWTLLLGAVLAAAAWAALPRLLAAGWSGLPAAAAQEAAAMAAPLSLLLPLGLLVSLLSAWLMAHGRHHNTLLEGVPALALLLALALPAGWLAEPLVWGSLAGFALQLAGLGLSLGRLQPLQRPALGFSSPAWTGFWGSLGIVSLGQALMSLTALMDPFFAATLGSGGVATLSYASRIAALVLGLGALAISRVLLGVFSDAAATQAPDGIRPLTHRWALRMFALGLLAAILVWLLAPFMVALLFERGAFTAQDSREVAHVLAVLASQTPFYFSSMVFVSYFIATRNYRVTALSGGINLLSKAVFAFLLVGPLAITGLALATTLMHVASLAYFVVVFRRGRPQAGAA